MQVLRILIRNQYDTGCANTGSHTLIINDNTPLSLTHSCSQAYQAGDGSEGENQEEETIRVIRGRKVAMPRQPASKGSHRLYVTCVKDA